jgi:hypothetical protein
MLEEHDFPRRSRPATGLRLVEFRRQPVHVDPRDGFPWRGLAAGMLCWLVIGLVIAAL